MLENFIYAQTEALYKEQYEAGNVPDESITFVEETGGIWNRGNRFGGMTDNEKAEMQNVANSIAFLTSVTKVTSVVAIPSTSRLVIVSVTASEELSLESTPSAGKEICVIINNPSTADMIITLPTASPYIIIGGETTLTISAGGYAEINVISDGTNIYLRTI